MASRKKHDPSLYRVIHHLRHGGLHDWARAHGWSGKNSDTLPEKYKHEAAASNNKHVRGMGQMALTFEGFHHPKKK